MMDEKALAALDERVAGVYARVQYGGEPMGMAEADRAALVAEVRRLREALTLAEEAMNHMGDSLNEMDVVEASDEHIAAPAFKAVRIALGHPLPGDEA